MVVRACIIYLRRDIIHFEQLLKVFLIKRAANYQAVSVMKIELNARIRFIVKKVSHIHILLLHTEIALRFG